LFRSHTRRHHKGEKFCRHTLGRGEGENRVRDLRAVAGAGCKRAEKTTFDGFLKIKRAKTKGAGREWSVKDDGETRRGKSKRGGNKPNLWRTRPVVLTQAMAADEAKTSSQEKETEGKVSK